MRDIPTIFSAPMIRSLWDGRKTQTRRILKPPACIAKSDDPTHWDVSNTKAGGIDFVHWPADHAVIVRRPFPYAVGDRLWVRENVEIQGRYTDGVRLVYGASRPRGGSEAIGLVQVPPGTCVPVRPGKLRPAIHMPRWASRLTLVVEQVRVERLQDISEEDARAEGAEPCANGWWFDRNPLLAGSDARGAFYCLWSSIHGADAWDANPYVVAPSFTVHKTNIDLLNGEAAHG